MSHGSHEPIDDPTVPRVTLEGVTVRYGDVTALDDVHLSLPAGELLAVVGPSGCGKSTLIRAVAGLTVPDEGRITIGGRAVADATHAVPPESRGVGVVFQDHALFPHLRIRDNVAFGLRGVRSQRERVAEVLDLVGLARLADRYPHELSGGEQQRAALARALAPRPAVLLLDEPFSHLDRNLRDRVREETVSLLRAEGVTAVFVTHDREEALTVGSRLAVLRAGRIEQVDRPEVAYHTPANRFVATFLDEADLVPGWLDHGTATTRFGSLPVQGVTGAGPVEVMVRPHEVVIEPDPDGEGTVASTQFRGGIVAHRIAFDDGTTVVGLRPHTRVLPVGATVHVAIEAEHALAAFPDEVAGDRWLDPARR